MDDVAESVVNIFGTSVFSDVVMRERLPKDVYKKLKKAVDSGELLDSSVAGIVANAMKDWAIEKGATHYCHWFQPLTGMTAEKHDSFISPTPDGRTIMEFSGRALSQGESDGSSFPSTGLRASYEARGYTAWDCTSPVFVKESGSNITLFIPTAFCSYNGQALDKKTPLLRSLDALNKQAVRVLHALGQKDVQRVVSTLGAEQEYFLVDEKFVERRLDLLLCGRTLFGAPSPKGQEMEDHYFGSIPERVASYMRDLNRELWRMGVSAKTQHNEVAPAQYELAPIFNTINVATDHNQLVMETMQRLAHRHGLKCLLHEKPFAGVNGSGKHNNWSMVTDGGVNLLEPGTTPHENMQFLIMLCAVVRAVAKYSKLLRSTAASAGNDHRLGGNEAPPVIMSIFLGDQLTDIFKQLENGGAKSSKKNGVLKLGISTLPPLPTDCTDRNRTSPFAFTGNKFEFRMVGSAQSVAGPGFVLNTIVADALMEIADELENALDVSEVAQNIIQKIVKKHKNIIFNGDNYTEAWEKEAEKRGLPNIKNAIDALGALIEKDAISLFERHHVLSREEISARYEIFVERYAKEINIESNAALQMAKREILPAAMKYLGLLAGNVVALKSAGMDPEVAVADALCLQELVSDLKLGISDLENATVNASALSDVIESATAYRNEVLPTMDRVRNAADRLEAVVDSSLWPLPTYAQMLFIK